VNDSSKARLYAMVSVRSSVASAYLSVIGLTGPAAQ